MAAIVVVATLCVTTLVTTELFDVVRSRNVVHLSVAMNKELKYTTQSEQILQEM